MQSPTMANFVFSGEMAAPNQEARGHHFRRRFPRLPSSPAKRENFRRNTMALAKLISGRIRIGRKNDTEKFPIERIRYKAAFPACNH